MKIKTNIMHTAMFKSLYMNSINWMKEKSYKHSLGVTGSDAKQDHSFVIKFCGPEKGHL